jgi:hypothetical protein
MIYASLTTIPQRIKNLSKTINSLLIQTKKIDKIFINIPKRYLRFKEDIKNEEIPKFDNNKVEIVRCEDFGPGTKLLGSLKKVEKNSLVILVDDDNEYANYMVEKFFYFYDKSPINAYSFYVHPLGNFGVGQGADGFAINTNYLDGIYDFYNKIVKNNNEIFLHDDLWISYFLHKIKKNKILSLQDHIKVVNNKKLSLIYTGHSNNPGLIETYGKNLNEAIIKRDQIALKSLEYMDAKTKELFF